MECQSHSADELFGDTIATRTVSLLSTGLYSDIDVETTTKDTLEIKIFKLHRCILAKTSNVWGSAIKWSRGNVIKITEFPFEVIKSLIWFAYTGKLDIASIQECCEVIVAADFYNIGELNKLCSEFVQNEFIAHHKELDEIVAILNHAAMFNVKEVSVTCLAHIQNNPYQLFHSQLFYQLSADSIKLILSKDIYFCSEYELTKNVLKWAKNACNINKPMSTVEEFLILKGIDKLLRMSTLTPDQVIKINSEFPEVIGHLGQSEGFGFSDSSSCGILTRGGLNEDLPGHVVVRSPPMTIREEFRYIGPSLIMPVSSIEIEPRANLLFSEFAGTYEESLSIRIGDFVVDFEGVLPEKTGVILNISHSCTVPVENNSIFVVEITLRKPGIYKKNTSFLVYREGLMRIKRGLIVDINNVEKPLPYTAASTSHE